MIGGVCFFILHYTKVLQAMSVRDKAVCYDYIVISKIYEVSLLSGIINDRNYRRIQKGHGLQGQHRRFYNLTVRPRIAFLLHCKAGQKLCNGKTPSVLLHYSHNSSHSIRMKLSALAKELCKSGQLQPSTPIAYSTRMRRTRSEQ